MFDCNKGLFKRRVAIKGGSLQREGHYKGRVATRGGSLQGEGHYKGRVTTKGGSLQREGRYMGRLGSLLREISLGVVLLPGRCRIISGYS